MDEPINISLAPDDNETLAIESEQPIEGLLLINQTRMKTLDIKEGKINYAYIQDKIKKESF